MIAREEQYLIRWDYLARQPYVTGKMRAILFDWMMEVSEEFMLKRESYYIAANYVERYLSLVDYQVPKSQL